MEAYREKMKIYRDVNVYITGKWFEEGQRYSNALVMVWYIGMITVLSQSIQYLVFSVKVSVFILFIISITIYAALELYNLHWRMNYGKRYSEVDDEIISLIDKGTVKELSDFVESRYSRILKDNITERWWWKGGFWLAIGSGGAAAIILAYSLAVRLLS